MSISPALSPVLASSAGAASCVGDCHSCLFCSDHAYPVYGRSGWNIVGYDVHCCFFDRRVTPVKGCSKFLAVGGLVLPHPLEH